MTTCLWRSVYTCSYQTKAARDVLDTILSIQPKDSSGGGGETRESVVYRLSDDMLDKLPSDYDPFEVYTHAESLLTLSRTDSMLYLMWAEY